MTDILFITPPFTQLNTPYPATAYLKGFFNTKGISSFQMDLGIEVICQLFTKNSLSHLFDFAFENGLVQTENDKKIYAYRAIYIKTIDSVIAFLQGKNASLARQICTGLFLPQASRFDQIDNQEWAFGTMGMQDKAKHLATMYLEDLSDFIIACVDENFGFSRYAEKLGRSANAFDEIDYYLQGAPTYIDNIALQILEQTIEEINPKIICFSIPFPGNLYSGFRCAQHIKNYFPNLKMVMGGGFPNTELRSLTDIRVFDYFDFIALDDGELPLELIYKQIIIQAESDTKKWILKRTFHLEDGKVYYNNLSLENDYKHADIGTPDYSDLFLEDYISVIEIANPMHSLWSDGRWNKLTMAHGCYWAKCTFCDVSLDYVKRYDQASASIIVDRMETIMEQTGETGFHFVDEAAPPALMRAVAIEILQRELTLTWWTNIRFEKSFTLDLCKLLSASGCIAVSGGLEVASDRLLKLIKKGVTVGKVAKVAQNLTHSGIMVHAYLMYGFPTQTEQETINSLELVRQIFSFGLIQSAYWHQFALTAHSPIGLDPESYGVVPKKRPITFADNDVDFDDITGYDHAKYGPGLRKSLFNFMHDIGFDAPIQSWFEFKVPLPTIFPQFIEDSIAIPTENPIKSNSKLVWIGVLPNVEVKANALEFTVFQKTKTSKLKLDLQLGNWFYDQLFLLAISNIEIVKFSTFQNSFETEFNDFDVFWKSKEMESFRDAGLLVL